MNGLVQDLRYAVRAFARNPGFTLAALLSVAIGVGANSAIFSVASALLLRPLPYRDAERLAILWSRSPGLGIAGDASNNTRSMATRGLRCTCHTRR
jgi:hypothetical protein